MEDKMLYSVDYRIKMQVIYYICRQSQKSERGEIALDHKSGSQLPAPFAGGG